MKSSIFKNKLAFYLASRYATYGLQFVISMVIAVELGPYYMGIWGFILLLLQYFAQFHFGIANSFNILYVHHRENPLECNNYIGNSLLLIGYLSVIVVLFYLYYHLIGIRQFCKFHVDNYMVWVCLIAILQYFVNFFINLFRVKNQLNRVTFCQSVIVILTFFCILFFRSAELIKWLVTSYVVGNVLCVIIALTSGSIPKPSEMHIRLSYQYEIIKKGLLLFFYNSCFYFIIISVRTVIGVYYEVDEFGMFTFSFSLAHAILLVLEALSFVIFPKVIGKLSSYDSNEVKETLSLLRLSYITSAHLLIYLVLPLFPIIVWIIPKYAGALTSMNLIALTVLLNTNSFGYTEFLMARNNEKKLAILSASALALNIILSLFLTLVLHVSFSYVILATMVTYFSFTLSAVLMGERILTKQSYMSTIKLVLPARLFVPFATALCISLLHKDYLMFLPIILFGILNIKSIGDIVTIAKKLIYKPEIVNL